MVDVDGQRLLLTAQRGDSAAFGEIVQRYQTSVYGVCLRLLGDRFDAEDAAQEAFVRAYQRLHTFDHNRWPRITQAIYRHYAQLALVIHCRAACVDPYLPRRSNQLPTSISAAIHTRWQPCRPR